MMKKTVSAAVISGALMMWASSSPAFSQTATDCPPELQGEATCYTGADENGSHYWIAIPENWNKTLVMHAHGGPRLGAINKNSNLADLKRFAVTVRQGFAWAGASYRRPGYGVRMAAEDTENLRQIFVKHFGTPKHTILHGQSWGGNVAAKGIELYATGTDGKRNYDGVILTNGMLGGGSHNYLHRADLRAVYQYYCNNHPRPDEPQYPLWTGLPADSTMNRKELEARVNECTGIKLPAEQRTEAQRRNLENILAVIRIPERTLVSHLSFATLLFRDITQRVLDGRNPFSNRNVVYRGSSDNAALNLGVARFDADPAAVAQLAHDSDMTGRISVPVLTMHAIHDPTAMVEYEANYKEVVTRAGRQDLLVQTFTTEREHSKLADPEYAALFSALMQWVTTGQKASAKQVAAECEKYAIQFQGGCHFDTAFEPQPLFSRVAPR